MTPDHALPPARSDIAYSSLCLKRLLTGADIVPRLLGASLDRVHSTIGSYFQILHYFTLVTNPSCCRRVSAHRDRRQHAFLPTRCIVSLRPQAVHIQNTLA